MFQNPTPIKHTKKVGENDKDAVDYSSDKLTIYILGLNKKYSLKHKSNKTHKINAMQSPPRFRLEYGTRNRCGAVSGSARSKPERILAARHGATRIWTRTTVPRELSDL